MLKREVSVRLLFLVAPRSTSRARAACRLRAARSAEFMPEEQKR